MPLEFLVTAILVVVLLGTSTTAFAQQIQDKCSQVKYSKRLTDAYPYRLKAIEGQAVYGAVSEQGELQGAAGLCVVLFNRKNKRLIAGIPTDSAGQFKFADVAAGRYLLVVSVAELHEIAVPVEVIGARRPAKRWELMLHLRSKEDRKRSFVTPITQPALRLDLLEMYRKDQAVRNEMIQHGSDRPDPSNDTRMALIDGGNTARLKAIIKQYGWPGPELVGADGASAAFMLVQHSPDVTFEQAMLPLVRRSHQQGKLSAWNYALLVDRVLVRTGKPQRYGMSLEPWTGKEPILSPIEDEANVDKRRAKLGLPPLREYLEKMKRLYFPNQ